jgi:hypothetical protein
MQSTENNVKIICRPLKIKIYHRGKLKLDEIKKKKKKKKKDFHCKITTCYKSNFQKFKKRLDETFPLCRY